MNKITFIFFLTLIIFGCNKNNHSEINYVQLRRDMILNCNRDSFMDMADLILVNPKLKKNERANLYSELIVCVSSNTKTRIKKRRFIRLLDSSDY